MTETVGVVIGTYGDLVTWKPFVRRAMNSVRGQSVKDCIWCHRDTLQKARNDGAAQAKTDWLIFLDADDELDSHYVEAMLAAAGDVRVPLTIGVYEDGTEDAEPSRIPRRDLRYANWVVIGAMQRRDAFLAAGGFLDYPILEDWALWRKLAGAGAEFCESDAIYRVHVRSGSRNQDPGLHGQVYRQILREVPL